MARKKFAWIWGLFVVLALAIPGYAQLNRGILEGTVTDPQGAFVSGAKVIVTALDTNITLPTTTNSVGYFRVVDLVPGNYNAHFDVSGFSALDLTLLWFRQVRQLEPMRNCGSELRGKRLKSQPLRAWFKPGQQTSRPLWVQPSCNSFPFQGGICNSSCSWCRESSRTGRRAAVSGLTVSLGRSPTPRTYRGPTLR